MIKQERTRDIYEELPGYRKPPLVPLPPPGDLSSLKQLGIQLGPRGERVAEILMDKTGFTRFMDQLPDHLESLLRRTNFRLPGLFAPVISATAALADEERDLNCAHRAAVLLLAARELCNDVFFGRLPPDRQGERDLEMGQYANFFSTSLVVEGGRASLFKSASFSQITVMVGGRIYLLDLFGEAQDSFPPFDHVVTALSTLLLQAQSDLQIAPEPAVGLLTAASDRTQLKAFSRLRTIEGNASNLDALRHSLLTLCLEPDGFPSSPAEAARLAHSTNLHNRWFHSSLQLVVFGNGRACAICSFSAYLDGNIMMRGCAELQRRAAILPLVDLTANATTELPKARALRWGVDERAILAARRDVEPLLDEQTATFELDGYGKRFFAAGNILPVPAFTLALLATAKRLTGRIPNVYQFLTMSKYRCMDLAVANVTTPEAMGFADYVMTPEFNATHARHLMEAAIASQVTTMRHARQYLGLDLLLGLFVRSLPATRRRLLVLGELPIFILLRILGLFKPQRGDILASHPDIYPEVPVLGRPGIRLPYVTYFGLHYQIMDDKTVVTLMPGTGWGVPNAQLVAELERSLAQVKQIIGLPTQ